MEFIQNLAKKVATRDYWNFERVAGIASGEVAVGLGILAVRTFNLLSERGSLGQFAVMESYLGRPIAAEAQAWGLLLAAVPGALAVGALWYHLADQK